MHNQDLIAASEFCSYYNIDYTFITSLQQCGLLHLTIVHDTGFIASSELQRLEKLIRLHYELDINMEGIEAITYLLQKVEHMQLEMNELKNKLRWYEQT